MGSYRIDLPGVAAVLTNTNTEAGEFDTVLQPLPDAVESAATCTGNSGAIVPALNAFFADQQTRVQGMATRIGACLTGTADAVRAYQTGDEEMAATYQANAVAAANQAAR